MKILNNFDTNLQKECYEKYSKIYGDNIIIINKGKIFYTFYIILPITIILIVVFLLKLYGFLIEFSDPFINNLKWIKIIFIVAALFPYLYIITERYIDYIMDFLVITPNEVIYYNQTWFFSHQVIWIDADKITTINLNRKWFIKSLLNFWDIYIATEGEASVNMRYIDNPLIKLDKINYILKKGKTN